MSKGKLGIGVMIILFLMFGLLYFLVNVAGGGTQKNTKNANEKMSSLATNDNSVESLTSISAITKSQEDKISSLEDINKKLEEKIKSQSENMSNSMDSIDTKVGNIVSDLQERISSLQEKVNDYKSEKDINYVINNDDLIWVRNTANNSDKNTNFSSGVMSKALDTLNKNNGILGDITGLREGDIPLRRRNNSSSSPADGVNTIPVYTLPVNSTLTGAIAMTSLIGRVPVGTNIRFPVRFKIITSKENLITNGIKLQGVKGAVWSGYAFGDRTIKCVRGIIDSVTFTFLDGRIATFPEDTNSNRTDFSENSSNSIGWISDPKGNCISGKYVSNAPRNLAKLFLAGFAQGASQATSQSQISISGTGLSALNGNAAQFAGGAGVAQGLNEWSSYISSRAREDFDVIYKESGTPLTVHITKQIEIDYTFNNRKVSYFDEEEINNDLQ